MCRNIRVLHHFEPPTTQEEIAEAALQYVRKVSGMRAPTEKDREAFATAVLAIETATAELLEKLAPRREARTRDGEREKARNRWERRAEKR